MTNVPGSGGRTSGMVQSLLGLASILVVGFIVQLSSERAYWMYSTEWFTIRVGDMVMTSLVYAFALTLPILILASIPFSGPHQIVLAGALFGWTVEGVVVQVLHEGGPLDLIFPAMFVGWHGVLSFFGFFYLVRRWLLARRRMTLALVSAVWGAIIGVWATTSWLPDSDQASALHGVAVPIATTPLEFAGTVGLLVATLAAAHLILDRLWAEEWRPGRLATLLAGGATITLALGGFSTIPWAPIRYLVLSSIPLAALLAGSRKEGLNLFGVLSGRVRGRDLWALAPAVVVASTVYAIGWLLGPAESAVELIRALLVSLQVALGGALLIWALVRATRDHSPRKAPKPSG